MHLEIAGRADLDRAEALATWLRRPHVDQVAVRMPGLDSAECERSARAIRHLFNDCGCTWGALALLVAAVGVLVIGPAGWPDVGGSVLGCLAAAAGGKLLGLAWSRYHLLARLRALRSST
ncbi:MAG TPA: hypothetical protein VHN18_07240 [Micromonosporaceae bacterium]|nr:hypothetical protein [Micromonosporaceae bacterium]